MIVGIIPEGQIPDDHVPVPRQGFMTGLILAGYAIHAATADATGNTNYFDVTLSNVDVTVSYRMNSGVYFDVT